MSLQINISSREIAEAYENVVNARGIDWALFTYEGGTNDLKVQSTGSGGLEELADEFRDGRCAMADELRNKPADEFPFTIAGCSMLLPESLSPM